jgi:hypothetical protein
MGISVQIATPLAMWHTDIAEGNTIRNGRSAARPPRGAAHADPATPQDLAAPPITDPPVSHSGEPTKRIRRAITADHADIYRREATRATSPGADPQLTPAYVMACEIPGGHWKPLFDAIFPLGGAVHDFISAAMEAVPGQAGSASQYKACDRTEAGSGQENTTDDVKDYDRYLQAMSYGQGSA